MRSILRLPLAEEADRAIFDANERHGAPDLLNAEVLHAIRRFERTRVIDAQRSALAIERLGELPIIRHPTVDLLGRVWELRENFTAYDAMYVALAEALGASLVTADARLAHATRGHSQAHVTLLSWSGNGSRDLR